MIIAIPAILVCVALAIGFVSEMDKMKPNYFKSFAYGGGIFVVLGVVKLVCS